MTASAVQNVSKYKLCSMCTLITRFNDADACLSVGVYVCMIYTYMYIYDKVGNTYIYTHILHSCSRKPICSISLVN